MEKLYRKKPVVVRATQWFKHGDHAAVELVRTNQDLCTDYDSCGYCQTLMCEHGWIKTLEGGHIVCPGDYIITGVAGEHYPCKPRIFEMTYETHSEPETGNFEANGASDGCAAEIAAARACGRREALQEVVEYLLEEGLFSNVREIECRMLGRRWDGVWKEPSK